MNDATVEASNLSKSFGRQAGAAATCHSAFRPAMSSACSARTAPARPRCSNSCSGFTPPTGGAVRVFGHESYSLPGNVKSRVGFVPQQDELLDQLTVADQLRVIASFYPRWDSALIDAPVRRVGRESEGTHQEHVGGRAAEAVDPAGVRAQSGSADAR